MADLPPALFAGVRFLAAGALMFAYAWWRGGRLPPTRAELGRVAVAGLLMLAGANGLVTFAEQWIESNQAALIVATAPLWLALVGTWGTRGESFSSLTLLGLLLGFGGVAVLVGSGVSARVGPPAAYLALSLAPVLWAIGTIYSRRRPVTCTAPMNAALQMLVAGAAMTVLGLALGDAQRWRWTPGSALALAYLAVLGSCLAYGAYSWLVHEVPPARLGTYAYVNPAVAVLLGWWVLGEVLGPLQVIGTLVILASVVLVTLASRRPAPAAARAGR